MRRYFLSTMVAIAALMPAWAFAGEQDDAQRIATGIRQSGQLKDYSIGVKFENGTAYLMGRVASDEQAETAIELAKTMDGVTEVVNNLEIKPTIKQDYEVTPTSGDVSSRRTVKRDEVVFGAASRAPSTRQFPETQTSAEAEPSAPAPQRAASQPVRRANYQVQGGGYAGTASPIPIGVPSNSAPQRTAYDQPHMPCYSWPSYASYPNYGAVTYPQQYSASSWPYIGPFYPYPQVPLGWRRVSMEWKDGWWWLDFNDHCRPFRHHRN